MNYAQYAILRCHMAPEEKGADSLFAMQQDVCRRLAVEECLPAPLRQDPADVRRGRRKDSRERKGDGSKYWRLQR